MSKSSCGCNSRFTFFFFFFFSIYPSFTFFFFFPALRFPFQLQNVLKNYAFFQHCDIYIYILFLSLIFHLLLSVHSLLLSFLLSCSPCHLLCLSFCLFHAVLPPSFPSFPIFTRIILFCALHGHSSCFSLPLSPFLSLPAFLPLSLRSHASLPKLICPGTLC